MTKPTPPASSNPQATPAQKYCRRLLHMNPLYDAAAVLEARRKAFGLKPATALDAWTWSRPSAAERQAVEQQLERLRRDFWTLPQDSLKAQLGQLNVRRLPELQPVVARLRMVAACRGEFPRLVAEQGIDRNLFAAFKTSAVLPPAEGGPVKEQFLRSLHDPDRHRQAVATAKRIRDGHPLLYQLEKDWFDTLIARKKPKRNAPEIAMELPEFSFGAFASPGIGFLLLMLLKVLLLALR